jgi:hypothetical protein
VVGAVGVDADFDGSVEERLGEVALLERPPVHAFDSEGTVVAGGQAVEFRGAVLKPSDSAGVRSRKQHHRDVRRAVRGFVALHRAAQAAAVFAKDDADRAWRSAGEFDFAFEDLTARGSDGGHVEARLRGGVS